MYLQFQSYEILSTTKRLWKQDNQQQTRKKTAMPHRDEL